MHWRQYLQVKTRQPHFLWRWVAGILIAGLAAGYAAQGLPDSLVERWAGVPVEAGDAQQDPLDQLAADRRWGALWWSIPQAMWEALRPGPTAIALLTGACWLMFLLQAGQPGTRTGIRWPLAVVAVVLGVASIWPTLFAIYWQEEVWQLRPNRDLVGGLRYFILGVGLREELCKLLLFLPLVPWIVRRGSQREALLVAACVGLGFAVEENAGYFHRNAGDSLGRFLTANFVHMALTGLAGLAGCRGLWYPRQCGAEAAGVVLLVILLHGAYDALIVLPALAEIAFANFIVFVLLAYQFFRELRASWQPGGETVSLTATFLTSVALVVATSFVYLSALHGFGTAIDAVVAPGIGLGLMVYLFLREMPESIIDA